MNSGVRSIANQPVKSGYKRKGNGKGTSVPKSYGSTLGMKPKDFSSFKSLVNQPVPDPYKKVREQVAERSTARKAASPADTKTKQKFVDAAKKRFDIAAESEAEVRKLSLDDLKFLAGDQWPDKIKSDRRADGRPCLTINQMPQYVRQVTNEQRQNRPSIEVNPVDDDADIETAEIIQGIIRHIEYDSAADAAYDTAFFHAATHGFGYWRVTTEYSSPFTFEQDIKIKRVRNPFTVYLDPNAKEPDFSDADYGFIVETLAKDEFKKLYPDAELSKMENWQSIGDNSWLSEDSCRIVEYYYREKSSERIVQLKDGSVILKEYLPEELKGEVVNERDTEITTVKWCKLNGIEVLDETEWAGQWIPIIKVVGDEFDIDGKLVLKGIVRDAKEPQQQYNFMKSASTEAIALAPKAPYIGFTGQFSGHEAKWQQANSKNFAFLEANAVDVAGKPAPIPQRQVAEPAIQAINLATMDAANDLKAVTGIYAAALGEPSNERTGIAIQRRQQQTQSGNFHYIDNLTRAIRHCGRVIIDLLPHIYDTERVIRIVGPEGDQKTVTINQKQEVGKIYDMSVGKYDVTIQAGPSYQTRRQEAVASIIDLTKAFPELMGVAGDILVKNMDWPGAQQIAERLKKQLPPNIQDDEDEPSELPPQVQQQIQQQVQMIQQLQAALQHAEQDIQQKISVEKLKLDSHERIEANKTRIEELRLQIEAAKVQAAILTSQATIDASSADATAKAANDLLSQIAGEHHQAAMADMQHQHSLEQAQQGQEFAQENQADEPAGSD